MAKRVHASIQTYVQKWWTRLAGQGQLSEFIQKPRKSTEIDELAKRAGSLSKIIEKFKKTWGFSVAYHRPLLGLKTK